MEKSFEEVDTSMEGVNVNYNKNIKFNPTFNNVLVRLINKPVSTLSLVAKNEGLRVEFIDFIVEGVGERVSTFKVGNRVILDQFVSDPSRIATYMISQKYNSNSLHAKAELIKSLRGDDYKEFLKNNPTVDSYEYIIVPESSIVAIINEG
jgi:hypothetical protein